MGNYENTFTIIRKITSYSVITSNTLICLRDYCDIKESTGILEIRFPAQVMSSYVSNLFSNLVHLVFIRVKFTQKIKEISSIQRGLIISHIGQFIVKVICHL